MPQRLSRQTLGMLPPEVACPRYDRAAVKCGIVHLGIGAFHRAHQAAIFDAALAAGDNRWGVVGVSLRSAGVRDQLMPQDGLYTLLVRDGDAQRAQVIGAVLNVLVASENPAAVVDALASPDVHIVTLTVTEKGYKLDPATGQLIDDDPATAADLASLDAPQTAPGFIVAGLARRRNAGLPPFTAISCDNLPDNGRRLEQAVLAIAEAHAPALARWIRTEGAFPQTMVDRIVPATTADDIAALAKMLGMEDRAMVKAEPFTQWVVEDHFAGPRPELAALGVQLTTSVPPWEDAKLRLLNGAHSAIAYLGGLAGIDFVHEVVGLADGASFVEALWDEAQETLSPPDELDIAYYRRDLMARFANSALQHRTLQIAMDGSQKLPQRLLATLLARIERGQSSPALTLAVAAWMRWQSGVDDSGSAFVVDDPMAHRTAAVLAECSTPAERVDALVGLTSIFPPTLASDGKFRAALADWLGLLERNGALAALAAIRASGPGKP